MRRLPMRGWAAVLLFALPLPVASQEQSPAAPDAAAVNAVWVEHDVTLNYMGLTSYYSRRRSPEEPSSDGSASTRSSRGRQSASRAPGEATSTI